jgi:TetR/AcrR family transcriptional regulator, regulator of cefoperazone and chloramphenicol sensitivity
MGGASDSSVNSVTADATPRAASRERQDGAARERLLRCGLRLFASKGFAATSTRELAECAQVNVAAISYYFGDKAGLYRAAFYAAYGDTQEEIARFSAAGLSLGQALACYFDGFVEPLRMDEQARDCVRLHFREMVEPSGLWQDEVEQVIVPTHRALVALLQRHLGLTEPDLELQRLALVIAGLGVHLHVGRDVADRTAPALHQGPDAVTAWGQRLVDYALAMVSAERQRRAAGVPGSGEKLDV